MSENTWRFAKGSFTLRHGDLTTFQGDAVVNAANSGLAGGGGVDGALHRAAGPELLRAGQEIVSREGRLAPGQAVVTPGFDLPAQHVIHTVGPIWRGGENGESDTLASAFRESLRSAQDHQARTLAFPLVGCGVYGFPEQRAAPIILNTIRDGLAEGLAEHVFLYIHTRTGFDNWLVMAHNMLGEPTA